MKGRDWSSAEDHDLLDQVTQPLVWEVGKGRKWSASTYIAAYLVREDEGEFSIEIDGVLLHGAMFKELSEAQDYAWKDQKERLAASLTPEAFEILRTAFPASPPTPMN